MASYFFRNYIFYIRIINIQRVKILQICHYFNFEMLSALRHCAFAIYSRNILKFICDLPVKKFFFCIRIINIQRVKILQIRHYFNFEALSSLRHSGNFRHFVHGQTKAFCSIHNKISLSSYFSSEITYSI